MKVTIKKVAMKNFLSVGNKWLSVDFRKGLYRVAGRNTDNNTRNGVGKSVVFCDSLMYGLFGKPLRKINMSDIPNTLNNKKDCQVKLWFSVGETEYLIHRSINPGFLKLYENYTEGDEEEKDNKNEKQDSAKKFTQERIDNLINSNFNTFSHLLIMSNTYTTPFLDLDAKKKREILEDILGITIFGSMADKAKTKALDLKGDLKIVENDYQHALSSIEQLEGNMNKLKEKAETFEDNKKTRLETLTGNLEKITNKITELEDSNEDIQEIKENINKLKVFLKTYGEKQMECSATISSSKSTIKKNTQVLDELHDKPSCPLCGTETSSEHITSHVHKLEEEINNAEESKQEANAEFSKLHNTIELIDVKISNLQLKIETINSNNNKIQLLKESKEKTLDEISNVEKEKNEFLDLIDENELVEKKDECNSIKENIKSKSSEKKYYDYIRKLLSDEGIKNYIIKKIIKFWNQKVNFYLKELNAEFNVVFDDKLDAIIKSRKRDPLQYHSFSGGEKARIDVAILLSIIDISKLQNSVDLNVMVIDELLDGGLDDNGREDVINLFKNMTSKLGKSIYVISHNLNIPLDKFDKEVNLVKHNGFTSFV